MDNCIHGVDVRNACETCISVEYLEPGDRKALERRASKLVETLQPQDVTMREVCEKLVLGELAMAWRAGFREGAKEQRRVDKPGAQL